MNQLNATLNKFRLELHRVDKVSPPITIAEASSLSVFNKMVLTTVEGKPTWNNDNNLYLLLTTPTGQSAESHAKNKLTGFQDLLKVLNLK